MVNQRHAAPALARARGAEEPAAPAPMMIASKWRGRLMP
jgi:hypothetical protein